jgi:hypothetical protein
VNPLPEVACPEALEVFIDDPSILLSGASPEGGIYSGQGVSFDGSDYYFDPATGIGSYEISYCYADAFSGCENFCVFNITVVPQPGDGQVICMPEGWSIISSYLQPDPAQLQTVFEPVTSESKMIIALNQHGIFWPAFNINTIGNWNVYDGYKVKMNAPGCIIVDGEMPENKTVALAQGTNYLPVLCPEPVATVDFFAQMEGLKFAYDIYNQLIYWPDGGLYTLNYLEPGAGYLVNMNQPGTVEFACTKTSGMSYSKAQPPVYHDSPWKVIHTGAAHFIALDKMVISQLQPGDFVGAFNSDGICTGMARVSGDEANILLPVYGNDHTTETTDGMIENEALAFRVFSAASASEYSVDVTFDPTMPNAGIFAENGQSKIIGLKVSTGIGSGANLDLVSIWPNPTKGIVNMMIPAMESAVTVEVSNMNGATIISSRFEADQTGTAQRLDLSGFNPGVYFVKISSDKQTISRKLVIQ